MTGKTARDLSLADRAAGINESYRQQHGLTWHHDKDMETMILVPQELNSPAKGGMVHTGGDAIMRAAQKAAEQGGWFGKGSQMIAQEAVQQANAIAPGTTQAFIRGGNVIEGAVSDFLVPAPIQIANDVVVRPMLDITGQVIEGNRSHTSKNPISAGKKEAESDEVFETTLNPKK